MMTVGALIEKLLEFSPDSRVVIPSLNRGYPMDIGTVDVQSVRFYPGSQHELEALPPNPHKDKSQCKIQQAVFISGCE